ncbi:Lsr2 family DNA-binding protein [Arthrobacter sp. D3-16]
MRSSRSSGPTNTQVRAWAQEQEQAIKVNHRGPAGTEILAQYEAAH